jgi:predicted glycosyltransferase
VPSPRILLYASDLAELAGRDVTLAEALLEELSGASLVVATGSESATRFPPRARLDIVKVPGLERETPMRPLEVERIRRLRQKLLRTLFDVFMPDLLLLDLVGPEAEAEARLLLARAKVFGTAALVGLSHDEPSRACGSATRGLELACERCREKVVREARLALAERDERRRRS